MVRIKSESLLEFLLWAGKIPVLVELDFGESSSVTALPAASRAFGYASACETVVNMGSTM
jgi:hypothetical protein